MFPRLAILSGTLAALAAFAPSSAQAQRVSLSPTIGVYIPTSELVKAAEGQEFKQEVALSVGGRLGVTLSPRFGIETSVSYVPSNLRFTFDQTETTTDANLLFGTVRASFHAIPMTSPVWLTLNGGASMIRRGGQAYEKSRTGATSVAWSARRSASGSAACSASTWRPRTTSTAPRWKTPTSVTEPDPERRPDRVRLRVPGRSLTSLRLVRPSPTARGDLAGTTPRSR